MTHDNHSRVSSTIRGEFSHITKCNTLMTSLNHSRIFIYQKKNDATTYRESWPSQYHWILQTATSCTGYCFCQLSDLDE